MVYPWWCTRGGVLSGYTCPVYPTTRVPLIDHAATTSPWSTDEVPLVAAKVFTRLPFLKRLQYPTRLRFDTRWCLSGWCLRGVSLAKKMALRSYFTDITVKLDKTADLGCRPCFTLNVSGWLSDIGTLSDLTHLLLTKLVKTVNFLALW